MVAKRRIAAVLDLVFTYGRDIRRGAGRRAQTLGDVELESLGSDGLRDPADVDRWAGEGVLFQTVGPGVVDRLRERGIHAVCISGRSPDPGCPQVIPDQAACGRLAAEHLLDRGFERFGYIGFPGFGYSIERRQGFVETVGAAGYPCLDFEPPDPPKPQAAWQDRPQRIRRWLSQLPRPIGLMACADDLGRHVATAAGELGFAVPDEIAVIAVNNDELLCDLASPPLSSVALGAERIGEAALDLLLSMIDGQAPPPVPIRVEPLGVVTRKSSDVLVIDDPLVREAVRLIHSRQSTAICVEDLLEALSVSRRTLELRFRKAMGRTPGAEIRRFRLQRARNLLIETELPMPRLARAAGFRDAKQLSVMFRKHLNETPTGYRARMRKA